LNDVDERAAFTHHDAIQRAV